MEAKWETQAASQKQGGSVPKQDPWPQSRRSAGSAGPHGLSAVRGEGGGATAGAAPGRGAGTRGPPTQRDTQAGGRGRRRRGQERADHPVHPGRGPSPGGVPPGPRTEPFAGSQISRCPSIHHSTPPMRPSNLKRNPLRCDSEPLGAFTPHTRGTFLLYVCPETHHPIPSNQNPTSLLT